MGRKSKPEITVEAVVDWLVGGAKGAASAEEVLDGMSNRLVACGVPIDRSAVFVRTLHPSIMGRSFFWRSDESDVQVAEAPHSILQSDLFLQSPIAAVYRTGKEIRQRFSPSDSAYPYPLFDDLKAEGITDYIMIPLEFTDGQLHAVSWSTHRPGGFATAHIAALRRIQPALSRLAEVMALRRVTRNLLDAYLGHQSGDRVLAGDIKLGDGDDIHAVIWFCDLRDSTPLANCLSRQQFLAVLNQYFECMAGAVLDGEGEVLRFIGDAVSAIFPVNGGDVASACEKAVCAAADAMGRMARLNEIRRADGVAELGYGIGLHLGYVLYGNIGVPNRIEFSVTGAAANEAARIEGLCKVLGQNFLASGDVVNHLAGNWRSLGFHALRGLSDEIEVFTDSPLTGSHGDGRPNDQRQ